MARYFLEVMYDGTAFHGSQLQGETPTVQLAINSAIGTLLRKPVLTFGASRTDEGVHALCNFYHFDLEETMDPNFLYRLNAILPQAVAIKHIYTVADDANARFDAIRRRYRYKLYTKKDPFLQKRALYYPFHIDIELLNKAAIILKGYNDFETFSKRNTQSRTFRCTLYESYWERKNETELHYIVEGNRFLRGMVRGLVGTQLKVARGYYDTDEFIRIIEGKDCTKANFSVTGHGLYLEQITYPDNYLTKIV